MTLYYPAPHDWQRRSPAQAGFDADKLAAALAFAQTQAIQGSTDLAAMLPKGDRHPNDRPLGPLKKRGPTAGLIVRQGYLVAAFGPVASVEVTFSCAKSYISALAGVAFDQGLIRDLDEPVGRTVLDGGFDAPQNQSITWRHLLQQTSEWEGELFGLPDWIDRGRQLGQGAAEATVGGTASSADNYRSLEPPGTFWEYNDVRVNRTALSLLRLFRGPLPPVLKQTIMDPIGASPTWEWHGYETSYVEENQQRVQSVSGGTHWGGGLWISTYDHARFGLLFERRGHWNGRQILSKEWIDHALTPCPIKPEYGFLWWLNHQRDLSDLAGPDSFAARGAGGHVVFVEPERELVIVLRWCGAAKAVIDRILASEV